MINNILDQLKRDEGEVLHVYPDSKGIRTAGCGHNLEAHGIDLPLGSQITQEQSDEWLKEDVMIAVSALRKHAPWTEGLMLPDEPENARHAALVNMCFNMGWGDGQTHGLSTFHHFLTMVEAGNYDGASQAMLESKWSNDVGKEGPSPKHPLGQRAYRLSQQMKTGEWV